MVDIVDTSNKDLKGKMKITKQKKKLGNQSKRSNLPKH